MGKITGFLEIPREMPARRPVAERLKDWQELEGKLPEEKLQQQGARCMDCGIPFCHKGCPLGNIIPDWNDLVYRGRWKGGDSTLHSTNIFPGAHSAICRAPCVEGGVRPRINGRSRHESSKIEKQIIDHAFKEGGSCARAPDRRTDNAWRSSVGPAGLAARATEPGGAHGRGLRACRSGSCALLDGTAIPGLQARESGSTSAAVSRCATRRVVFHVERQRRRNVAGHAEPARGLRSPRARRRTPPPHATCPSPAASSRASTFAMDFLPQQNKKVAGDVVRTRSSPAARTS
jgi:glutamate synthase (NADPH/NADH) small chain